MSKKRALDVVAGGPLIERFETLRERIARRAYEIFESRDSIGGDHVSDWLQAEDELLTRMAFELVDDDGEFVIQGQVEDFEPDEINVQVWPDHVAIAGSFEREITQDKRLVFRSASFVQRFDLPQRIDPAESEARIEGRTLAVTLPKATAEAD